MTALLPDGPHEPGQNISVRPRRPRLSARVARLLLAREMWMRANGVYDGSEWDNDALLSTVYEKYIARADEAIRDAMARGERG